MAAKDERGRAGEHRAARFLGERGFDILARNWRCDQGELDIVAATAEVLAFVEVKTRRSARFGHPFEAVDERKRRRLWRLAHAWIAANPDEARGRAVRLQAIGIVGEDPATADLEYLTDLR